MANTNAELVGLQQEKEDIEDDKHCLEMEMCAGRERLQGLKVHAWAYLCSLAYVTNDWWS